MFSKIKSLCKKFYRSRKSVASFVLAMMLAFSAFIGTGIKSEAAYATQKFYFDLTRIKPMVNQYISDNPYLYIFKTTNAYKDMYEVILDNGSKGHAFGIYLYGNAIPYRTYKYYAIFSSVPLFCNDTDSRSEIYRKGNILSVGVKYVESYNVGLAYSNDGINWTWYTWRKTTDTCTESAMGAFAFNPKMFYLMCSYPIRQIYNGEVAYLKNLSAAEIQDWKNLSSGNDKDTDTDGNVTGGSSTVTGGSGSSGSGSSGSNTEEEKGFFASVKESLSNILTNIKELPSAVVNVPTTMINFWKNFIGSHSIGDIITAVKDAPSNIFNAWKSFFGSHTFLELLNAVKNVPATVSSWWKDNLPSVIQAIKDVPLTVSGWWSDHLPELLQAIVDTPTTVWNWWKEQLPDVVNAIIESPKTVLSFWKDFFKDHSFSDILQAIADAPKDILRFWENLFGSDSIKDIFKDLLDVPSNLLNFWDDTIVGFIESVESKFTFIEESKSNIQLIIDRLTSMSNPKPPVITLPFSKTVMSKYGVGDIEMTFEWLAPYHELLMNVESACLYVAFCVRNFFDVKNMLNATSGASNVLTRL